MKMQRLNNVSMKDLGIESGDSFSVIQRISDGQFYMQYDTGNATYFTRSFDEATKFRKYEHFKEVVERDTYIAHYINQKDLRFIQVDCDYTIFNCCLILPDDEEVK